MMTLHWGFLARPLRSGESEVRCGREGLRLHNVLPGSCTATQRALRKRTCWSPCRRAVQRSSVLSRTCLVPC